MNVVLVRVLYAHAPVLDADLALGRSAFVASSSVIRGHAGPQALLSTNDVLLVSHPIDQVTIEELIDSENRSFGRWTSG